MAVPPTCSKNSPYDPADRAFPVAICNGCTASIGGKNWDDSCESAVKVWNTRADQGDEAAAIGYTDAHGIGWLKKDDGSALGMTQAVVYSRSTAPFVIPIYAQPRATADEDARKDAEAWGDALNEAAWVFVEECPEKSARLFNNTKGPLRSAILKYLDVLAGKRVEVTNG